jgi:hypothetical protein
MAGDEGFGFTREWRVGSQGTLARWEREERESLQTP